MLSVFQTDDLTGLKADGIVGLSPSNQRSGAALFINELYNSGVIDQRVFGFYVSKGADTSKITIGGYDLKYAD